MSWCGLKIIWVAKTYHSDIRISLIPQLELLKRKHNIISHVTKDLVYWPVYCPSTACTQGVYWMYTEHVLNVYGFLKFQDWPCVLARPRPVHKTCNGRILNVYWTCMVSLHTRIDRVYWPVYCPYTACTQDMYWVYTERVLNVYWACTVSLYSRIDRVYWPVHCPSTACTQDMYWVYTERVLNVYGFLIFQDWPRVLTRPLPVHGLYTRAVMGVY